VELEQAVHDACAEQPWFTSVSTKAAAELTAVWRAAVAAHEAGDIDVALDGYRAVLAEQPEYGPAQHLLGVLLRDRGRRSEAEEAFKAAIAAAPAYSEARLALANLYRNDGRGQAAGRLCVEGLALAPNEAPLWRALGQARLAQRRPRPAHAAFKQALALAPADGETHYNQGVAYQMWHRPGAALRAYQRALALVPGLTAADFNIGVVFRERGHSDAAISAFEQVLARDPRHVAAYKALAELLLAAGRIDDWLTLFDRFAAACPAALPLVAVALQACQYRGDFAQLDWYLDRLQRDEFKPASDTELADSLEELLYLLLFFDVDPEFHFHLYKRYDAVVARVYGRPLRRPKARRPGRIRVGYLSGDLRDHVMGKMMWSAIERYDRDRFEFFFYSLSPESDQWTERYRGLSEHFEVVAPLSEEEAAKRIGEDDLDLLVDLATNTYGAKPGILALKPARVQITHVATAGVVGLSTIDFKLTDTYADLPESQAYQLETLLPMQGCVYPYRHIAAAEEHPFHRERLGLTPEKVVIGAFVNPLKLSRRCLALWREILERIPNAVLAISPRSVGLRSVYGRLFSAAGIANTWVCVVPQGRSEAENQARYNIVDFVLDPMPFGSANGTIEPLDMGVPVVTLAGRRHSERCAYSILANLGVTQTVARSGSEYVEIAVRLASDAAFAKQVRETIRRGLERSPLTDMEAHTRHLEQAYLRALDRDLAALAAREP
jgi:predicted O-linked N-acetylglucosamine transferase (SPINDLY family)